MMRAIVPLLCALGLMACPSSNPSPTTPPPASSSAPVVVSAEPSASATAPAPSEVPIVEPPGTAVKAPIFSDDDCSSDNDCVPQRTCHPALCRTVANAGTMPAGMMCTMDCRGGTLDCNYNHCGCAANSAGKKKCAVLPGPSTKHP